MTTFVTYTRTSRKHRTGKPQIHILALRDGRIVGQIRGTTMPPERVVEFCSQHFASKQAVDRCDPILL